LQDLRQGSPLEWHRRNSENRVVSWKNLSQVWTRCAA